MTEPLFQHQAQTVKLYERSAEVFDTSDPGTGKTRAFLDWFSAYRANGGGSALVVAPKSLLDAAWGADIARFYPHLSYKIAWAGKRENAFTGLRGELPDIVGINHDGVKWMSPSTKARFVSLNGDEVSLGVFRYWMNKLLAHIDVCVIDEITAFKHHTSQRFQAMARLAPSFEHRAGLTGTPFDKSVSELWAQAYLLDLGATLGTNFYSFRNQTQVPVQSGADSRAVKWVDKPGMRDAVASLLSEITIRHKFDECVDIPPHTERFIGFEPSRKLMKHYLMMKATALLLREKGNITAVNAAVLRGKLLQIASGAVYDDKKNYALLSSERYELVADLVAEDAEPCVVFYNWTHQKEQLAKELSKHDLGCEVIDGSTTPKRRKDLVGTFQQGNIHCLLLHPATGAHGLTLTRGRRTIICSPFDRAEFLKQAKFRITRPGQTMKTETILVHARNTVEDQVYQMLGGKMSGMTDFLELLE